MTVLNNHHRAIIHVAYALPIFLAFLENVQGHMLAGENYRLNRVRQFVDIQDRDALQLGHTVQVEIVRQDRTFQLARQNYQLIIHFAHTLGIDVADAHKDIGEFL